MEKENSKNTSFLCEKLIQAKTTDLKRGRLYGKVKPFSIQRNIGDFHKDFNIQQIEKLAHHRSYYKILGKHHVSDVPHKSFEYTPGDISTRWDYSKRIIFEPDD